MLIEIGAEHLSLKNVAGILIKGVYFIQPAVSQFIDGGILRRLQMNGEPAFKAGALGKGIAGELPGTE